MLYNAAMPLLVNKILKGIPFISFPNNPRNKKKEKKPLKYLFVSTKIIEKKDEAGVMHRLYQGTTCKRAVVKAPSKRDIHRNKQEN